MREQHRLGKVAFVPRHGFPIHHAGLSLLVAGENQASVVLNAQILLPIHQVKPTGMIPDREEERCVLTTAKRKFRLMTPMIKCQTCNQIEGTSPNEYNLKDM